MKRILSMIVVMALVFTLLGASAVFAGDKDEANDEAVITSEESQGENESVEVAEEGSEENTEVAGEAGSEEKNSEEASEAQGEEAEALTQTPDDGIAPIDDATYNWSGDSSAISDSEGTITITGDGTLTLTADTTANIEISSGTVTLDLGGRTLTGYVTNSGTLTITNGTISNTSRCLDCISGTTTIESSATITCTSSNTDATVFVGKQNKTTGDVATLNVYGTVTYSGNGYAIAGNGSDVVGTVINIYDGALVTSTKPAIYLPQTGTCNIYGGEVSGYCGIVIRSGTLNISGGTVKGTQNDSGFNSESQDSEGGAYFDGSAIIAIESSSEAGYAGNIQINITGGTVESSHSYAIRSSASSKVSVATNSTAVSISGGTIVSDGTTGVIGGSDGSSVLGSFTISGGTFDGTTEADVTLLQSNATDAVAKLSTDDDCYYVGADAIKAAVEAYTGTDTLTLTVISGDLSLDVEKDIYVVNSGSGNVTVNGVSVPAGKSDPTLCPKQTNPQTGDASSLYLWAVLALAALLGGAVAVRKFAVRR